MAGESGFIDTGTCRSVGIGLSVLWYRVIVQRKNTEWLFAEKLLDPDETEQSKVMSSCLGSQCPYFPVVLGLNIFPDDAVILL